MKEGPINLEAFKRAFRDRFFPWEKREGKVEKFINLHQGGKSVQEYCLKFIKFSKYDSSLLSNPRDEMNHFVTIVSYDLVEECRAIKFQNNMDLSRFTVHAQQVEDIILKKKIRDSKRSNPL